MTKTVGAALLSHIAGEVSTKAKLIRIVRLDGEQFAFTDLDRDIVFGGVTYAAVNALDATSIESRAGLSVANLDFMALIDSSSLTEEDLRTGLFDFAAVEIREVNYADLDQGAYYLSFGTLGEIGIQGSIFKGELRGLAQYLQQVVGRIHQRRCGWDLGDDSCTVDLYPLTAYCTVTSVSSRLAFTLSGTDLADDWFNFGLVTWTSGVNVKFPMEVKRYGASPTEIELFMPMPFNISVGDTFSVYPGCDKNRTTCLTKFNNVVNFGGFPDMPGRDQIVSYPDNPY